MDLEEVWKEFDVNMRPNLKSKFNQLMIAYAK